MEGLLNTLAISGASLVGKAAFSFATSRFVNEMTQKIKETSQKTKLGKEVEKLNSSIRQKLDLIRPSIELIQSTANKGNSNLNAALELIATFIENLNKTKNEILKDTHFQLVFENTTTEIKSKTEVSVLKTINQLKEIERDILDLTVYLTFTLQSNNLNFDTSLNLNHISTSILLKSSNYFNNVIYDENKNEFLVGPTFFVRLFSLFGANARKEDVQSWTWKEEFPKCTLNLKKPKPINEDEKCFKYFFSFTENLNDGRYHESTNSEVKIFKIEEINKIYYSSSGKLLNLTDSKSDVLVLKLKKEGGLDFNWIAIEMQLEDDDECDSDIGEEGESSGEEEVINVVATKSFDDAIFTKNEQNAEQKSTIYNKKNLEAVSKLQLIEYLIRLCSLEYSENTSHLNCYDEQINLCLKNDYDFTKNKLEQNVIGESRREVGELDSVLTNNENITLDKDSPFRIRSEESPRNVISKTPTKSLKNFDGKSSEHLSNKMRQLNIE